MPIYEEENFGHYSSYLVLNSARVATSRSGKIMPFYKEAFTADFDFKNRWELHDADFSVLQDLEARSTSSLSSNSNRFRNAMIFLKKSRFVLKWFPLSDILQCLVPKQSMHL